MTSHCTGPLMSLWLRILPNAPKRRSMLCKRGVQQASGVPSTPAKHAERVFGVNDGSGFTATHLWPSKFLVHLLAIAVVKDVNFKRYTPVTLDSLASERF